MSQSYPVSKLFQAEIDLFALVSVTETFKHIRTKHRPESEYFTVIQVKEEFKKTRPVMSLKGQFTQK